MLSVYTSSPLDGYSSILTSVLAVHGETKRWAVGPLLFFPAEKTEPLVYHGFIHNGKLNGFGERECSHVKYDGEIYLDPSIQELAPGDVGNPYVNRIVLHKAAVYSHVLVPGQKYSGPKFLGVYNGVPVSRFEYSRLESDYYVLAFPMALKKDSSQPWRVQYYLGSYRILNGRFEFSSPVSVTVTLPANDVVPFLDSLVNPKKLLERMKVPIAAGTSMSKLVLRKKLIGLSFIQISTFDYFVPVDEDDVWGELAKSAIDSTRYVDTNGIQFLMELRTMNGLFRQITGGLQSIKAASGAYLAYQYGLSSQMRDLNAYFEGARRAMARTPQPWRAVHSSRYFHYEDRDVEYHYKVFYKCWDNDVLDAYAKMNQLGFMPNLEMAWDFVPFSFMIDWFVGIGDVLDRIDYIGRSQMYNVLSVTKSVKISRELSKLDGNLIPVPYVGHVKFVTYNRTIQQELDVPKWKLDRPDTFRSIPEATALIIQSRK